MTAECARRMQIKPMRYERLVMTIRENLRPHLSMQTPASRQPIKLPIDNMPADQGKVRIMSSGHQMSLTDPAGLLGGDDHVVTPHAPPVIGVPCDVQEGGQGGAGEPYHGAVQQTAQGGAKCGQNLKLFSHLKKASILPSPVSFCCGEMIVEVHCCSLEHPRSLRPDCLDLPSSLLLILTLSHRTKASITIRTE